MTNKVKNRFAKLGKIVVESDAIELCDRVCAYDPKLVLVYDQRKNEFQVCDTIAFPHVEIVAHDGELSPLLLEKVMKANNSTEYGFNEKMDQLEYQYETEDYRHQANKDMFNKGIIRELQNADVQTKHFTQGGV